MKLEIPRYKQQPNCEAVLQKFQLTEENIKQRLKEQKNDLFSQVM